MERRWDCIKNINIAVRRETVAALTLNVNILQGGSQKLLLTTKESIAVFWFLYR